MISEKGGSMFDNVISKIKAMIMKVLIFIVVSTIISFLLFKAVTYKKKDPQLTKDQISTSSQTLTQNRSTNDDMKKNVIKGVSSAYGPIGMLVGSAISEKV
jgi:cytoskeletal protein RodZ